MKRSLRLIAAIGLLATGYFLGASQVLTSLAGPTSQGNNCQTFPETKQTVCGRFLAYWQQNGGLTQQGFPISGELQEKSDLNGQVCTMQYIERAEFEYHPENQPPYDVLLSQLGTFEYKRKYQSGGGWSAATFVGGKLIYSGLGAGERGVQGPPCRGLGCPQNTIISLI